MKAVLIREHGGPDVLRWDEIEPPVCTDDQLLVEVKAASINPVSYTHLRARRRGDDSAGTLLRGVPFLPERP